MLIFEIKEKTSLDLLKNILQTTIKNISKVDQKE